MRVYTRGLLGLSLGLLWAGLFSLVAAGRMTSVAWQGDPTPTPTDVSTDPILNAYFQLGTQLMCVGDFEAAYDIYSQALEYDPRFELTYSLHISAYDYAHLPDPEAILRRDADTAQRYIPDSGVAHLLRAAVLFIDEQYVDAIAELSHRIELLPPEEVADGYQARAYAYQTNGDYEQALADYSQALQLDPDGNDIRVGLADLYREMGDYETALQYADLAYQYMMENDINNECVYQKYENAEVYAARARVYLYLNEVDAARQDFTTALELDPLNASALLGRGQVSLNRLLLDEALSDFLTLVELRPDVLLAYSFVGYTYYHMNDYATAIEYANRCLELDSAEAFCYMVRGAAYWGQENQNDAFADLNQAISLDASLSVAYFHRGVFNYQLGNSAEALADLHIHQALSGANVHPFALAIIQELEEKLEQ